MLEQVTGYVSDVYAELIDELAERRGSTKSNIIKKAVEGYFDNNHSEEVKRLEKKLKEGDEDV